MDLKALAERLLPGDYPALSYYEELYPPRDLEKGAEVTRLAPSPSASPIRAAAFCICASRIPTRSAASRAPWRR